MYTQCPECDVAFRVTAEVLKQAAGKVRCGGCGVAFNALAHLSEEMPAAAVQSDPEPSAPKLTPDEPGELEADTPPKSISAAQSAALLKTLDQLAGEDIRIEDTGVEWRVLDGDDDEGDEVAADPAPRVVREEMRFDDDTPLPDDFDLDAPSAPPPEPVAEVVEPNPSLENSQVDLAFGEPDEWEDLLGDLEAAAAATVATEETDISVELAALPDIEEVEAVATTDEPLDMDTQFAIQAEAMGIDLSGMHDTVDEDEVAAEEKIAKEEAAEEHETSIDEDLIAAAFEAEAAAKTEFEDEVENLSPEELSRAGLLDEDDYLEVITEDEEPEETEAEEEEVEAEPEEAELEEEEVADEAELEEEIAEEEVQQEPTEAEIEAELELALEGLEEEEMELGNFAEPDVLDIPQPTEAEKTLNMAIDQDLLAIAVEDDDGFTSTIVQKQISSEDDLPKEKAKKSKSKAKEKEKESDDKDAPEEAAIPVKAIPLVETIIMEGDFVHSEEDVERRAADRKAASASLKESGFDDDEDKHRDWEPPNYGMIAASLLLLIVLVAQVIHHSREALATSATFQDTVGPVYRMVGSPVTPAWDIKGWRFEATKGSTDEESQVLTIYSRIGNTSQQALPYPLVHVSLNDRFEEVIGSRVLEPVEYLVGNSDPRRPVEPGNTFDAVISIESPSVDATGFKLNVCYRLTTGQLRCAIEDFK